MHKSKSLQDDSGNLSGGCSPRECSDYEMSVSADDVLVALDRAGYVPMTDTGRLR